MGFYIEYAKLHISLANEHNDVLLLLLMACTSFMMMVTSRQDQVLRKENDLYEVQDKFDHSMET
jgi:hypothetical protein